MSVNSEEIKSYIREHSDLFWYIKKDQKENISLDFLVETILNYGSLEDAKKLFALIGIKKTASIFLKNSKKNRNNYFPKVNNFFTLYFERHA
ncbi:MAG: hypothetical protein P4L35_10600 [Ignavibacteriaceae bacterium]|nr:hypothetical protein [Ignavibacteriaceae bacterium]